MRNNYIIFYNAEWIDSIHTHPAIPIGKELKLYITRKHAVDRRTKEYKQIMLSRPNPLIYHTISASATVEGKTKKLDTLILV